MTDSRNWLGLLLIVGAGFLLHLLAPVLTPFFIAAFLAYMTDPLADRLEARGLSRTVATSIVFTGLLLLIVSLLLILVPSLERQITTFISKFPFYIDWLQQTGLPKAQAWLGLPPSDLDISSVAKSLKADWQKTGGVMATLLGSVSRSGVTVIGWLIDLLLIPVVTFYLLRDWDVMMAQIRSSLPLDAAPVVVRLAKQSDEVLSAFLRGQFLVMVGQATIYTVGLWIVGLDLALLVGLVAGVVSFVPYLGFITGIVIGIAAALAQYQDLVHLVPVMIVFAIGQLTEAFLLTPLLIGGRIGLHPVTVIFAVLAGGELFGFFGILLALPVAAVVRVVLGYLHERYMESRLYDADADEESAIILSSPPHPGQQDEVVVVRVSTPSASRDADAV